jgi:hypothetical protein
LCSSGVTGEVDVFRRGECRVIVQGDRGDHDGVSSDPDGEIDVQTAG